MSLYAEKTSLKFKYWTLMCSLGWKWDSKIKGKVSQKLYIRAYLHMQIYMHICIYCSKKIMHQIWSGMFVLFISQWKICFWKQIKGYSVSISTWIKILLWLRQSRCWQPFATSALWKSSCRDGHVRGIQFCSFWAATSMTDSIRISRTNCWVALLFTQPCDWRTIRTGWYNTQRWTAVYLGSVILDLATRKSVTTQHYHRHK